MTSTNDVITSQFLLIWKALIKTFYMRYYTIWYRMVPSISKFDLGVGKFRPEAKSMKVKAYWPQILISWLAAHMLLSRQFCSWSDKSFLKNKGFVDNILIPQYDLDLWPWNSAINEVPAFHWQLYKRCYVDVRPVEEVNAEQNYYITCTKTKQTSEPCRP
jgi:hypothetical protein